MDESLLQEEKDLMIQIYGKIVTREKLEGYLDWEQQQYEYELETQRCFPY